VSANIQIEAEIQTLARPAPRVTPEHVDSLIDYVYYLNAGQSVFDQRRRQLGDKTGGMFGVPETLMCLTLCIIVLRNGFTVTGESACASIENFDAELGKKIALLKAKEKIWPLEAYLIRERLGEDHTNH
jgi:hypothetical protein